MNPRTRNIGILICAVGLVSIIGLTSRHGFAQENLKLKSLANPTRSRWPWALHGSPP